MTTRTERTPPTRSAEELPCTQPASGHPASVNRPSLSDHAEGSEKRGSRVFKLGKRTLAVVMAAGVVLTGAACSRSGGRKAETGAVPTRHT